MTCTRWYLTHSKKYVEWEQTRIEQGTWPTKIMVSLWFSNEANLPTRIGLLDVMREELTNGPYKQKDQVVSSRLELSPRRKPLAKAHALFYKGLEEVKGDKSKIHVVYDKIQISFFVGSAMAANCTPDVEKVLQEKYGMLSRKSLQESAQDSVNPFLRPLSTRSGDWAGFSAPFLTART